MSLNDSFLKEDGVGAEPGAVGGAKEYTVVNQDPALAFQTLAKRVGPERQECSVLSSLFHFTEVEHLTHNNSLLCVACTRRQGESRLLTCNVHRFGFLTLIGCVCVCV